MGSATNNPFIAKQLKEYGPDGIKYCTSSLLIKKYVQGKAIASESSAATYRGKLWKFAFFVHKQHDKIPFDDFIKQVQKGKYDPYDVLADFAAYLKEQKTKPNEIRAKVKRVYKFLRYCKIEADLEDFHDRVPLPRQEFPDFEGTEKQQIVELLENCAGAQRLKTGIMLYGAMGCRAIEGCAVRLCDVDFDKEQITFRKEYTKMRVERIRPMTAELVKQLRIWLKWKYRTHPWVHVDGKREVITPQPNPDDLVLATWDYNHKPKPEGIYDSIYHEYQDLAKRMNMRKKNGRRVITFHRLRAFCKTTISDLGYGDFSEWFIGHGGSTYYRKPEKERMELFRKIEPHLTFADVTIMEAKQRDTTTQLEASQVRIRNLEDTVAMLVEAQKEREELEKHRSQIERDENKG